MPTYILHLEDTWDVYWKGGQREPTKQPFLMNHMEILMCSVYYSYQLTSYVKAVLDWENSIEPPYSPSPCTKVPHQHLPSAWCTFVTIKEPMLTCYHYLKPVFYSDFLTFYLRSFCSRIPPRTHITLSFQSSSAPQGWQFCEDQSGTLLDAPSPGMWCFSHD